MHVVLHKSLLCGDVDRSQVSIGLNVHSTSRANHRIKHGVHISSQLHLGDTSTFKVSLELILSNLAEVFHKINIFGIIIYDWELNFLLGNNSINILLLNISNIQHYFLCLLQVEFCMLFLSLFHDVAYEDRVLVNHISQVQAKLLCFKMGLVIHLCL